MTHGLDKTNEKQENGETPKKQDHKIQKERLKKLGSELDSHINNFLKDVKLELDSKLDNHNSSLEDVRLENEPSPLDILFNTVEKKRIENYHNEKNDKKEFYKDVHNDQILRRSKGEVSFMKKLNFDNLSDEEGENTNNELQGPSYTDIVKQSRNNDHRSPGM